jgi:uncharacterized protein YqjF (DUF2071 family)
VVADDLLELLAAPARQGATVEHTQHRPWPLPERPWVMGQTWDDLLFVHYRVPLETLRALVPDGLEVEEHSGTGWLGVTPFVVTGLRARGLLPLPFVSSFRELNVRTYVMRDGKPGIWFFSLDASSQVAVEGARRLYRLPYFRADISSSAAAARSSTTAAAATARRSGPRTARTAPCSPRPRTRWRSS